MSTFETHVRGEIVNKSRLGLITGKNHYDIDQWIKEGIPVIEAPDSRHVGEYKFATAQVIEWLLYKANGFKERLDLSAERAKLAKAQATGQFLKNDIATGKLILAEVIENQLMSSIGRCRALLLGIPSSSAGQIVLLVNKYPDIAERKVRELLTRMVDAALHELVVNRNDDDEDEEA